MSIILYIFCYKIYDKFLQPNTTLSGDKYKLNLTKYITYLIYLLSFSVYYIIIFNFLILF